MQLLVIMKTHGLRRTYVTYNFIIEVCCNAVLEQLYDKVENCNILEM